MNLFLMSWIILFFKGNHAFGNKTPKTFPKGTSLALIAATMLSGSSHTYSQNKFTFKNSQHQLQHQVITDLVIQDTFWRSIRFWDLFFIIFNHIYDLGIISMLNVVASVGFDPGSKTKCSLKIDLDDDSRNFGFEMEFCIRNYNQTL